MEGDPALKEGLLASLKADMDRLSESTVCEKTELNWPAYASVRHVWAVFVLWLRENLATLFNRRRPSPKAASETSEA